MINSIMKQFFSVDSKTLEFAKFAKEEVPLFILFELV